MKKTGGMYFHEKKYLVFTIVICILLNYSIVFATTDDMQGDKEFKLDDIFDEYILLGLAELYYGSNNLSGNLEGISDTDRFAERINIIQSMVIIQS